VKLNDDSKIEKVKQTIEVFPNPTYGFANVVVGYDYEKGTATLVAFPDDISNDLLEDYEWFLGFFENKNPLK